MLRRTIVAAILCAVAAASTHAQWVNSPAVGIPRTRDRKPNLSAPTPRGGNGRPHLSGVWSTDPTPFEEMERLFGDLKPFAVPGDDPRTFTKYFLNIFADVPPRRRPVPAGGRSGLQTSPGDDRPPIRRRRPGACRPAFPWATCCRSRAGSFMRPGLLAVLYEGINPQRLIYTDGRKLPVRSAARVARLLGRQVGRRCVGRGEQRVQRPELAGRHRPPAQRSHRASPSASAAATSATWRSTSRSTTPGRTPRPFSVRYTQTLMPDTDILEYICTENEKDRLHLTSK